MNRGSKAVLQMPYTNANSPIYGILDPFHANATSELSLRPVPTTLITFFLYSVLARITNPRQQERIFTGLKPDFVSKFR